MAKDIIITPASGTIEFKDGATRLGRIYESNGNVFFETTNDLVIGDGSPADVEFGALNVPVSLTLLGGGSFTGGGNTIDIGAAGDTINLNVSGVTYNMPTHSHLISDIINLQTTLSSFATSSYVSTQISTAISNLIDSAPGALDTLNELAAALGDDPNFATTITNALAGKLSTSGKAADSNLLDGIDSASFLRSDTADSWSGKLTYTGSSEGLEVAGIRGNTLGSQTGDYIHLYERVHIGYSGGWGASAATAPSFGLGVWGGINLGMDGSGVLQINGTTIVTAARQLTNVTNTNWDTAYGWGNHAGLYLGISAKAADSNLLDGIDSSQFMRSDTADSFTAVPTFANGSSGALAARTGYSDFLGYNPTYGSYIGGGVGNATGYLYAGGYFHDGTNVRALIHAGNISSQSVSYATTAGSANSVAWSNVSGRPSNVSSFTNDSGYITGGYLADYTSGSYRVIADYGGNTTWYIRSSGQFIFGSGHDWTASFRLGLDGYGGNTQWAYFGQQDSNATNGTWRGVRIRKYAGGAVDGDLSAGAYYIGDTRKDTNWDSAYSWGNHAGLYAAASHSHTFASITSKPTTLAGYGITDAATSAQGAKADTALQSIAANSIGASQLNVSGNGTTSQYLRSDGDGSFSWVTPPDNNTTYSAGTGLTLSGTTFSVTSGTYADASHEHTYIRNVAGTQAADACMPSTGYALQHFLGQGPSGNDGHILGMTWTTASAYGAQLWIDTDPNNLMAFRSRSSAGVWTGWNNVYHSGNLTLATLGYTGATNANYITNNNQLTNGAGYITSNHSHTFASLTSKPTTLGGYGITDAASSNHKYHSFSSGEYYYDSYSQGNYLRMFTQTANFDQVRFRPYSNVESSSNGTTWVSHPNADAMMRALLDGREDTTYSLPLSQRGIRFEVNRNSGWPTTALIVWQETWSGLGHPNFTMTIETWDGSAWVMRESNLAFNSSTSGGNYGTHMYVSGSIHNGQNSIRVTVVYDDWSGNVNYPNYSTVPLVNFMILSNYSGLPIEPFTWNYDQNLYVNGQVYAAGAQLATQAWASGQFAASAHTQAWSTITSTPTTLAGYGITDAATSAQGAKADTALQSIASNSIGATQLNVSGNGTTAQYLRSDGDGSFSWVTPPDTNTTYSAGTGLTLSGTQFSVTAGTYAAASHTHDDRYFTETESDNRYMRADTDANTAGAIRINGSYSYGTYTAASNYKTGADNLVLKGNASGVSGIFFESEKDGTNINHPSDFGFIQYSAYGTGTSGESNELIIGVSNDADDHLVFNAPDTNGLKFRIGSSTTDNTVYHSGNLSLATLRYTGATNANYITNNNQLTNGAGYITSSGSISGNAATATLASTVTINYNNNSNSTYQMLWGSGTSVYGTGSVYLNPSTNYVYASSFNAGDWFRSSGSTGWYNGSYGGGIYMTDGTWVRVYNNKQFLAENIIQSNTAIYAPIFYDTNNTNYFVDPASTSNLNTLYTNTLYVNGIDYINYSNGIHSGSDFVDGTLVKTTINASGTNGASFIMEVTGKSYVTSHSPFDLILQGYIYNNTFIATSAISNGTSFPGPIQILEYNGELCFWWPRWGYWNSFNVKVRDANGNNRNQAYYIGNSTEPASSKKVAVTPFQSWTTYNFSQSSVNNWNSAYAWGNHGSAGYAPLASPGLTGTPTAPTASAATNNTQIATTQYVTTAITNLIGGAPGALDTLNELAAAINDDASYASNITTALGGKVAKTGDTMTGSLSLSADNKAIFGPNSGWGKYLSIGGNANNSDANTASIGVTNGNLHIDAAISSATYLNYYDGAGGVGFGSGAGAVVAWMGPDGDLWKGSSDNTGNKYWHAGDFANNSTNWNTAYNERNRWDGGSTGLVAATGRTSLGLGTAATANTGDFAAASHSHTFASLTSTPTTLAGYGITDALGTSTSGSVSFTGSSTIRKIFIDRSGSTASGISWYSSGYTSWATYMGSAGQTGLGATGNITAPSGTYVTSWALRNFIENAGGYGWTWEAGTSSGQPSIVAELSSSSGNFRTVGIVYASGGNSSEWNSAYSERYRWDGGASGINAATGRASLGLGTAATSNTGDFAAASHSHTFASLTSKPTTISGYGITDAITTGNIGSQSVSYSAASGTAGTSLSTSRGIIEDTRSAQRTPNDYDDYRVSFEFTNQMPHDSNWLSIMTMQGWSNGYNAWQIQGPATSSDQNAWYLRSGRNTTWGTANLIIHSGNISSQSVSYANSAGSATNADTVDSLHASSFLRSDTTNGVYRVTAGDGNRIQFWDSTNYAIWMSSTGNSTWGGRLDTTSDYNMYFRMSGGTNRGFVFKNSTTDVVQIAGDGTIYTASHGNSSNWKSAYDWGNHANAGYLTSVPAQSFASLTGKPTTLSGYGITDAATSGHNHDATYLGISATAADSNKLGGIAAASYSQTSHNHTYNVNDAWLRDNGDNANVKLYGNSRQMVFRTDGTTEYASGVGGYAFAWMYGGDASGNRRMLLGSDGTLWTSNYGWLHSYFQAAGSAINTGNIGSQSVEYSNRSLRLQSSIGTWGGAVTFNNFRETGRTRVYDILGYDKVSSTNPPATPLQDAAGAGAFNYGTLLSVSGDYAHFEMYMPNNTNNIVHPEYVPYFRTGYQGGWSNWSRLVTSVDNTTTLVGNDGTALVIDSQVGWNTPASSILELNAQSDNWASSSFRFMARSMNSMGTQLLIDKYTYDGGWRNLGYVPENGDDNLFWMADVLQGASDSRLKTNVNTLTGALETVSQLRAVTFDWDPEMQEHHRKEGSDLGFIAQEIEELLPEVVATRPDGYKTVKYEKVVPVLVEAIKEQQATINALIARIEALENK